MILLKALFNKAWMYALVGGFIFITLYQAYKAGGDKEKLKQLQKDVNNVVKRRKIEDDVDRMSDSRVIDSLRRNGWFKESD